MEVAYCLHPTLFLLCSLSQKTIVKILSKLLPKIKNLVHPRLLSELSKINLLLEANRCSILWWLMSTQAKIPFPSFLSRNESQDLCSKQGVPSQAVGAACTRRRPCYCWLSPSKQTTTQSDRQLTLSIYGYRRIETYLLLRSRELLLSLSGDEERYKGMFSLVTKWSADNRFSNNLFLVLIPSNEPECSKHFLGSSFIGNFIVAFGTSSDFDCEQEIVWSLKLFELLHGLQSLECVSSLGRWLSTKLLGRDRLKKVRQHLGLFSSSLWVWSELCLALL